MSAFWLLLSIFAKHALAVPSDPWLRRFPAPSEQSCSALLLRPSTQAAQRLVLFEDTVIKEVVPSRLSPITNGFITTERTPRVTLLQRSELPGSAATAVARMLVSELSPHPLNPPEIEDVNIEDVHVALDQLGYASRSVFWRDLDDLQDRISSYGPGALKLELSAPQGLRLHTILVDNVRPESETLEIRDPYHGWAITVWGRELLRLLPQTKPLEFTVLEQRGKRPWYTRIEHALLFRGERSLKEEYASNQTSSWLSAERNATEARSAWKSLHRLIELDYRPIAAQEMVSAINVLNEQARLYPEESEEHAKLRLAALCYRVNYLRLHRESDLLELKLIHVEREKNTAEAREIFHQLILWALNPEERTLRGYAELNEQWKQVNPENPQLEQRHAQIEKAISLADAHLVAAEEDVRLLVQNHPRHHDALKNLLYKLRPFETRFGETSVQVLHPGGQKRIQEAQKAFQDWARTLSTLNK